MGMIRFYRNGISPFTPPSCRFQPTCSEYAYEAIETYGAIRGSWMGFRRILRCHPWGGSGWDPVPHPEVEGSPEARLDAGDADGSGA